MSNNNSGSNNEVYTEECIQQCKDLCEKYGFKFVSMRSWGIYFRTARDMGFNKVTDLKNVEAYFIDRKKKDIERQKFENEIKLCK